MKRVTTKILVIMMLFGTGAYATDIIVSWESNGVLAASGMAPGSTCTVEWTSSLDQPFTNSPVQFDGFIADSNGMIRMTIPMFFRVTQQIPSNAVPDGMVLIPSGTNSGIDPEFGAYSLTISNSFYMDVTEVSKDMWDTVYNWATNHGYAFDHAGAGKLPNHPIHSVNWFDCVKWCNARSEMEGETPCYMTGGTIYRTGSGLSHCNFSANGYRLPTIEEWEYAARGGLTGKRFPWGDTVSHTQANFYSDGVQSYDISPTGGYHPAYATGSLPYTCPVDSFFANGYGLHNMAGNVHEWCWSEYDGPGDMPGVRGGAWSSWAYYLRCIDVDGATTNQQISHGIGFRTVRKN